jgi:hypothetical protein
MRRSNPIKNTIKNFIKAGSRKSKQKKKKYKSNFVKFMESLENRGPLSMHGLYEKLTKKVRKEMEEANTWPKSKQVFKSLLSITVVYRKPSGNVFPNLIIVNTGEVGSTFL